jgi:transcription antitermination factor NusG
MERGGAMRAGIEGWLILRTQGRHTLPLAASLTEDGFEAWTPSDIRRIRVPRANVKRDLRLPLLPRYVFVKALHLIDMLELAAMPEKPRRAGGRKPAHREFSVFRHAGRIPVIADEDLAPLRDKERSAAAAPIAPSFNVGQRVLVPTGSFGGMSGTVVRSNGRETLVCFGTRARVRISTFILEPVTTYSGRQRPATLG